jgi:hypothetical protein
MNLTFDQWYAIKKALWLAGPGYENVTPEQIIEKIELLHEKLRFYSAHYPADAPIEWDSRGVPYVPTESGGD